MVTDTKSDAKRLSHVSIFGPPPLLEGEDAATYDELLLQVTTSVRSSDILEEIWVRDIIDLSWEILRLRRLKISLVAAEIPDALRVVLAPIVNVQQLSEWMDALIKQWRAQRPSAIKRVQAYLRSEGKTFDSVIAKAFSCRLDTIERIERLITIAEGRRNSALREIDRHRATFA
jgi:hypothetical protein